MSDIRGPEMAYSEYEARIDALREQHAHQLALHLQLVSDHDALQERYDALKRALAAVRKEIMDNIDGGEECQGRDSMLSSFIGIIDGDPNWLHVLGLKR